MLQENTSPKNRGLFLCTKLSEPPAKISILSKGRRIYPDRVFLPKTPSPTKSRTWLILHEVVPQRGGAVLRSISHTFYSDRVEAVTVKHNKAYSTKNSKRSKSLNWIQRKSKNFRSRWCHDIWLFSRISWGWKSAFPLRRFSSYSPPNIHHFLR